MTLVFELSFKQLSRYMIQMDSHRFFIDIQLLQDSFISLKLERLNHLLRLVRYQKDFKPYQKGFKQY
jgi:hypothetical protein